MVQAERVLGLVHVALLALLLAGLFRSRLFRISYAFAAYAATVFVIESLILLWPARFFVWPVFLGKEMLYGVLKLALLVEITTLTYQSFPSARALVRMVLMAVFVALAGLMVIGVNWKAEFPDVVRELTGRLALGTTLGFFTTWALILWYRIPLHRWHRAILRGLVPYIVIFAAARNLTLTFGWNVREQVNVAGGACYAVVLAYWCWEVWRRDPDEPGFLRRLQPWRARL